MESPANADLLEKIKAQGDVVRKLKEQKAEKVKVKLGPSKCPSHKNTQYLGQLWNDFLVN